MSGMEFGLTGDVDAKFVAVLLKSGAKQAVDTRVVMDKIYLDMLRVEAAVFSSQGRRGGGSWASLKPDTVRRKGTTEILMGGHGDEYGPDALLRSVTEPNAPFQILHITKNSVTFGTDRPYAETQQYGSGRSPARPFLRFTASDRSRWMGMIAEHLMKPFVSKNPNRTRR